MHIKTSKHVGLAKSVASNKNIQSMFCSESSKSDLAVVPVVTRQCLFCIPDVTLFLCFSSVIV